MRRATLAIAFAVALLCCLIPVFIPSTFASPAPVASPNVVEQLLQKRICVGCDLRGADLHGKDLRGVNLTRSNLRDADLTEANMMGVNVQDADLRGVNMKGATVLGVNFMGANLKDAQFGRVDLESSRLCHTITPDGKVSDRNCP